MDKIRILAINPGSTSTKIAVYENENNIFIKTIRHPAEMLAKYSKIIEQFDFRKEVIIKELQEAAIELNTLKAIVGRGGLLKPVEGGIYEVNQTMMDDLKSAINGEHASNLGALIAFNIAQSTSEGKAYIADPVVVDEMKDVARYSGHPMFERRSIFHALNQKAIARSHAKSIGKNYEDVNLIIAHLGGGISVGAHEKGRVIDVNNALDGEGPFSPERTGTLPAGPLVKLCFSGNYTLEQVKRMITGQGGLIAYLDTNDAHKVQLSAQAGDKNAKDIQEAMSYQIGKSIGEMAAVLKGKVDAIILTGGIAHNKDLVAYVKDMVGFIAPLAVYPGEDEMMALAMNGLMALRNELEVKNYQ